MNKESTTGSGSGGKRGPRRSGPGGNKGGSGGKHKQSHSQQQQQQEPLDPVKVKERALKEYFDKLRPENFDTSVALVETAKLDLSTTAEVAKFVGALLDKAMSSLKATPTLAHLARFMQFKSVRSMFPQARDDSQAVHLVLNALQDKMMSRHELGLSRRQVVGLLALVGELFNVSVLSLAILSSIFADLSLYFAPDAAARAAALAESKTVMTDRQTCDMVAACQLFLTVGAKLDAPDADEAAHALAEHVFVGLKLAQRAQLFDAKVNWRIGQVCEQRVRGWSWMRPPRTRSKVKISDNTFVAPLLDHCTPHAIQRLQFLRPVAALGQLLYVGAPASAPLDPAQPTVAQLCAQATTERWAKRTADMALITAVDKVQAEHERRVAEAARAEAQAEAQAKARAAAEAKARAAAEAKARAAAEAKARAAAEAKSRAAAEAKARADSRARTAAPSKPHQPLIPPSRSVAAAKSAATPVKPAVHSALLDDDEAERQRRREEALSRKMAERSVATARPTADTRTTKRGRIKYPIDALIKMQFSKAVRPDLIDTSSFPLDTRPPPGFSLARITKPSRSSAQAEPAPAPTTAAEPAPAEPAKLSPEKLARRGKSILEEYFSLRDTKEVAECLAELNAPEYYPKFISQSLTIMLEKKEDARESLPDLFIALVSGSVVDITADLVVEGLAACLDLLDDLLIDIPLGGLYVGRLVGRLIAADLMTISQIVELLAPREMLILGGHVGKLIAGMVRAIVEDLEDEEAVDDPVAAAKAKWEAAGVDIRTLVKRRFRETAVLREWLASERISDVITVADDA
ncbi:uncharacterized protein AMSG_12306 [Thecamonas trahens ATCC 50062]|uniref:MI domain-containing protein n=1 Tax=Thecamonas trahens ATCC 50062 TaxID=461836 RepID=A0A0L0DPE5_THETB|nr:hypothetical protein AMSG_12306 [Thecamonas trahens ATCC 50062]KNC54172.1 hypothetical protein AMSG_12306 [Thecamonas trahens ATCC 50062]|eukprot:XP_013754014.1 hypothetical protein AMSG_12306 [Thecamonas trahens ATCC 50062]